MDSMPDLSGILGKINNPTGPASVSTRYQPGPTEYPIGGVVGFAGGNVSIIGWGGRSRLEAAATAIFSAWRPSAGSYAEAASQAIIAAEALLTALEKRSSEMSNENKHASEGAAN